MLKRRTFIQKSTQTALGLSLIGLTACQSDSAKEETSSTDTTENNDNSTPDQTKLWFGISLAQWSLHKALQSGELSHLDFITKTRKDFDIDGVEYVNRFLFDKAKDTNFLKEMNLRADDSGLSQQLIMVDDEGDLGDADEQVRNTVVDNHKKWVDAAQFLGCHSIRVNAAGKGTAEEVAKTAAAGLRALSEYAAQANMNVIVENHGGYSSDGIWLSDVIKAVNLPNCGTLPDFGNFCIEKVDGKCVNEYDKYQGMQDLLPFAKAISAKSYDFDANGAETTIDFSRMLTMLKNANYGGFIGIEYEGDRLSEEDGIRATKALLEKAGRELMG